MANYKKHFQNFTFYPFEMFNENGHVFSIFPEGINGVPKLTSFFRNQRPLELMAHLLLSNVIESVLISPTFFEFLLEEP
jgi:hypothetical protein